MEENKSFVQLMKSDSDGDKAIARARTVTKIIERILRDWSFSAIRGPQRKKLVHSIFDVLRREKIKKRRGKIRYMCKASMSEARNRILDALQVDATFGSDPYMCVAWAKDWYYGGGLDRREIKLLHQAVVTGCNDQLNRHRFRQSPAASNREKVASAAVNMGADPQTAQLKEFAALFQAPLVITIKGNIKFERREMGPYKGYLRCQGVRARLYDKNTDTVLAVFNLKSDKRYRNPGDRTAQRMHCPWVGKADSLSEVTESYAQLIGESIADNVMKRLFDRYYANRPPPPAPKMVAKDRDCPGCGDKIVDGQVKECPACESPLPPAILVEGKIVDRRGRVPPSARSWYVLRLKGWDDTEQGEIVDALSDDKDFGHWSDKGAMGVFHVYKCTYVGQFVLRSVGDALEECGFKEQAKVTKTGNRVNILKRN